MYSRMLVAVSVFALTAACQDAQNIAAPNSPTGDQGQPIMSAASSNLFSVYPGDDVPAPTVQIIRSGTGRAFAGVPVSFTFGDGAVVKATTGADGNASANWPIDYTKSVDSVVAKADGVAGTVVFKALIVHTAVVATYELQTIGGRRLPISYSGGGSGWNVTGGRYRLFSDGTYMSGYELDGKQQWGPVLSYFRRDSTIEFYLSPETERASIFYANINYLFATATLKGELMSVKYSDPVDFEDEVYSLK